MHSQEDLGKEYRRRFHRHSEYRESVWRVLVSKFFRRYVRSDAAILDLGCGWGEFIRNIEARRRFALDLNPDMVLRVGQGIETIVQDCTKPWPLENNSLDLVFTSNFFEHLPDKSDIRETLRQAARCLKQGGLLLAIGPNIRVVGGKYWDFWDHIIPLTDRSLSEILELSGFVAETAISRFLPYSMSLGFKPPLFLVSLYVKFRFLWPLFGKQFLIVARKL